MLFVGCLLNDSGSTVAGYIGAVVVLVVVVVVLVVVVVVLLIIMRRSRHRLATTTNRKLSFVNQTNFRLCICLLLSVGL